MLCSCINWKMHLWGTISSGTSSFWFLTIPRKTNFLFYLALPESTEKSEIFFSILGKYSLARSSKKSKHNWDYSNTTNSGNSAKISSKYKARCIIRKSNLNDKTNAFNGHHTWIQPCSYPRYIWIKHIQGIKTIISTRNILAPIGKCSYWAIFLLEPHHSDFFNNSQKNKPQVLSIFTRINRKVRFFFFLGILRKYPDSP